MIRCMMRFVIGGLLFCMPATSSTMLNDCTNIQKKYGQYSSLVKDCVKKQFNRRLCSECKFDPQARNVVHNAIDNLNCLPQCFEKNFQEFKQCLDSNKLVIILAEKAEISFIVYAAKQCGRSFECHKIIEELLAIGCRLNSDPIIARNTFYFAALYNNTSLAWFLLSCGVSCDIHLNNQKMTALHIASFQGNVDMCRLLLSVGASVHAIDDSFATPLHYVCGRGVPIKGKNDMVWLPHNETMDLFEQQTNQHYQCHLQIIEALMKKGAQFQSRDCFGKTPYMYAGEYGHTIFQKKIDSYAFYFDSSSDENEYDEDIVS